MAKNQTQTLEDFNDLHGEISAFFHEAAVAAGISDSVQNVLYAVLTDGEKCTQSFIARQTGMSRQTTHSAIRVLEGQGLVEPGQKNQPVRLTPAGQAMAEKTVLPLIRAEARVFAGWTEEERRQLLRLTRRYLADLKEVYENEK